MKLTDWIRFKVRSHKRQRERKTIHIKITNLTEPQRLAIIDMLMQWKSLSALGSSRWVAFYADGDGDFHPRIEVNGKPPEFCNLTEPKKRWKMLDGREIYMIDFDEIAWRLHDTT